MKRIVISDLAKAGIRAIPQHTAMNILTAIHRLAETGVGRVIDLAQALNVKTDELLGVKPPKVGRIDDDSEARRMWKRFQMVAVLPERDQKAVIRLINSLAAVSNGAHHGH